jgi:DNA-binding NtrC family response regulator
MLQGNYALLVSGGEGSCLSLRKVLNQAGLHVRVVRGCAEARKVLADYYLPAVLFCDAALPDGTWADILASAGAGTRQVPVIVVSRVVDVNLYINALDMGASDFIVPPFYHHDISHVVRCAVGKRAEPGRLAAS